MSEASKYLPWRARFKEAIAECNTQHLCVKVQAADKAIRDRLHELANEGYNLYERQALMDALARIEVLKRELDEDVPSSLTIMC